MTTSDHATHTSRPRTIDTHDFSPPPKKKPSLHHPPLSFAARRNDTQVTVVTSVMRSFGFTLPASLSAGVVMAQVSEVKGPKPRGTHIRCHRTCSDFPVEIPSACRRMRLQTACSGTSRFLLWTPIPSHAWRHRDYLPCDRAPTCCLPCVKTNQTTTPSR